MTDSILDQAESLLNEVAPQSPKGKRSSKSELASKSELVEEQETSLVVTGLDTHGQRVAVYTSENGLKEQVDQVRDLVDNFDHNMKNLKGRNRTKALASNVGKFKARLEKIGKTLTDAEKAKIEDVQATIKIINQNVKDMSANLAELKIQARKPLTDWEAEKEEEKKANAQKELDEKMALLHENAIFMNEKFDAEKEAEEKRAAEQAELERIEHEKRIAKQAVADAELEVEELKAQIKAKEAQLEQEKREAEANAIHYWYHAESGNAGFVVGKDELDYLVQYTDAELCDKAKFDQVIAEQEKVRLAEQEKINAENLRIQQEQQEQQRLLNEQREAQRLAQVEAEKVEAERLRLQQEQEQKRLNNEYVAQVCGGLKNNIMQVSGVTEPQARMIVLAMRDGIINTVDFYKLFPQKV